MNAQALIEAHEAHVAAHGPDCGRRIHGPSSDPCVVLYRAWKHLSTGAWRPRQADENRIKHRAWQRANADKVRVYGRRYRSAHPRIPWKDREHTAEERSAQQQRTYRWRRNRYAVYRAGVDRWLKANPDKVAGQRQRYADAHPRTCTRCGVSYRPGSYQEHRAVCRSAAP